MGDNSKSKSKLKIAQPFNILVDIYGVITEWQFVKKLRQYAETHMSTFLTDNWNDKTVKLIINRLREQSDIDRSAGVNVPAIQAESSKSKQKSVIESAVNNIKWQMENKHKSSQMQLNTLMNRLWSEAYEKGSLKTHAFPDVRPAFEHWRFHQFIKIYTFASGPAEGQRQYFRASEQGDLNKYIANCIDSTGGIKYSTEKFKAVLAVLRESKPHNLLYLTDEPSKARSAIEQRLRAVVVKRAGNQVYTDEDMKGLDSIISFEDLEFEAIPGENPPCC